MFACMYQVTINFRQININNPYFLNILCKKKLCEYTISDNIKNLCFPN